MSRSSRQDSRALLVAVLAVVMGCSVPPPPSNPERTQSQEPTAAKTPTSDPVPAALALEQQLEDVTYRQTRAAVVQWELHAETVTQPGDGPATLSGVTLEYYADPRGTTRVTADEAEYDRETQNAVLRGNVHVVSPVGDTLDTEELEWNAQTETLQSDVLVTLRRGNSHLTGRGLYTSPGLRDVRIDQVQGIIQGEELAG